jgi:hypothetical protein
MTGNDLTLEEMIGEVYDPEIDDRVDAALLAAAEDEIWIMPSLATAEPTTVDLSPYVHLVRRQGGAGCWGYSTVAVWDIMNEMACPFSPNMSMRIWMMLHRRRELWESQNGMFTPDGRFHGFVNPEYGFLQSFGNTTEGSERTLHQCPARWPEGGWSVTGINEAENYRLASKPQSIPVTSAAFTAALACDRPFRLRISGSNPDSTTWGHWLAVVGYDKNTQTFKYLNSGGDRWGMGGYATYSFAEIDAGKRGNVDITTAETFEIHVPRPVPAARIRVTHTNRSNVVLTLRIEDSPHPPLQIWPQGWNDNSANLYFTVRLPDELVWPPTMSSRMILDVFDTGEFSHSGGTVTEFTCAFGAHTLASADVPTVFAPHDHVHLTVP